MPTATLTDRAKGLAARAVGRAFNVYDAHDTDLPRDEVFRPYSTTRRYAFSHINVVIPDLPAPHRHLACMALLGRPGARVFDNDYLPGSPRDTVTLAIGTAETGPDGFRVHSMARDCELREDGSYLRFGQELTITGRFPEFAIAIRHGGLEVDIQVDCTEQVTTFVRSPLYDHIGYPARYSGTLTWQGQTTPIDGLMSLEYARAVSLTAFRDKAVPAALKLPVTHFEWQVIKVAPDTLLMFAASSAFGQPLLTSAYIKQVDGISARHIHNVTHDVLSYRPEVATGPDGNRMRVPLDFRWRILDENGAVTTEIVGRNDTDLVYGLGRGWLGGFSYSGHHDGQQVEGTAYMEYVRI